MDFKLDCSSNNGQSSNQIKYIFATKDNSIENIQGIIKSKEAQKKPKGLQSLDYLLHSDKTEAHLKYGIDTTALTILTNSWVKKTDINKF